MMTSELKRTLPPTSPQADEIANEMETPSLEQIATFVPPRLSKQGKVSLITQDGFGGSLGFP